MNKTPVAMLHELMQRRGIVPQYELLPSEGIGTHMPTFYYSVRAENVHRIGKGRSKKGAQHEAAKLALEAFSELGIYHPEHQATTPSSPVASATCTASTSVQINAVGILKEFCAENNIPEPDFHLISDIGPAHLRHFTMECKIGTMSGISATDLTKKKAKQAAAQKMLFRLRESLPEVIEEYKDQDVSSVLAISQEVIDGYNENCIQKKKVNWGLKISSYPKTIKKIMEKKGLIYDSIWKDIINEDVGSLQDILNKLELSYSLDFTELEAGKIVTFISLNSDPEFILAETGDSKEEALQSALKPTFNFLRIMTK